MKNSKQPSVSSLRGKFVTTESVALTTALICAAGTAGSLSAQTQAAATGEALPEIVVEANATGQSYKPETVSTPKYTQPLRDVPQSISVVPAAVIKEQNATTLRDVLRNVPGISLQAGEGGGGLPGDNLTIRGFNARTDVFIDGVRDYGSYSRDPFNFEQVEVAKGPASSISGRGSTGGAINLMTKTPRLDAFYNGDIGGGTDDYFRVTLDINQPLWVTPGAAPSSQPPFPTDASGKNPKNPAPAAPAEAGDPTGAAFRLNALYHTQDVPGRNGVESERFGVAPSLAFGLGTSTRLFLNYFHFEEDNTPDYGIPWVPQNTNPRLARYSDKAPPVSFENFYGLRGYDFEKTVTDSVSVLFEHDFSDSLKLRNLTRFSRTERDSAITAPRFANVNNSFEINRNLQQRDITNEIWSNQTDLTVKFDTGPVKHNVVAGLEFVREEQDNQNSAQAANQPRADLFHPNPGDKPFGPRPENTGIKNYATAETVSTYLFDTIQFSPHWEITGGARYDHVKSEYESAGDRLSRTDDMVSWRTALVYKPAENGSIYLGYGTSFNTTIDGNTGLALNNANIKTDPEESRTVELGTKWDLFDERLSLTAAVFRTDKTDARTVDPTDPLSLTVLDGEQRVQGVELGFAGKITDWWSVYGGYTYLDSEIRKSLNPDEVGKELSNTPEHSLSLWTVFDLPGGFQLGGGAQYVDTRYNNNTNTRQAPDYWLFDAMLSYRVNENLTLRLNGQNLADKEYIDRLSNGHFIPGAGRFVSLTANLTF